MAIEGVVPLSEFLDTPRRLFIDVWATTKQGKSFFPLSFPKPLFIFTFEPEGIDTALSNAVRLGVVDRSDEIMVVEPIKIALGLGHYPLIRGVDEDKRVYDWVMNTLDKIGEEYEDGTLVFDTMTTFHEILSGATMADIIKKRESQKKDLFGFDYAPRNRALRGVFESIRSRTEMNLVTLHHASQVWQQGKPTSRWDSTASKRIRQWVDMTGRLKHEPAPEESDDEEDGIHWTLSFESARHNIAMERRKLDDPTYERIWSAIDGEIDLLELD